MNRCLRSDRNGAASGDRRAYQARVIHEQDGPRASRASTWERRSLSDFPTYRWKRERYHRDLLRRRRSHGRSTRRSQQRIRRFWFRSSRLGFYSQAVLGNVRREIQDRHCQAHEQTLGRVFLQSQDQEMEQTEGRWQQAFFLHVRFGSHLQGNFTRSHFTFERLRLYVKKIDLW